MVQLTKQTRKETDSLGEKEVPAQARYGVQTTRAIENFPISGLKMNPAMIRAIGRVKQAAAEANMTLGRLDARIGQAIARAAAEVAEGKWNDQFPVDVFQAGAGVSFNMNANEVIANRAIEILGGATGDYTVVHPNDHVNMSQSTNDVFPTALRLAALSLGGRLLAEMNDLEKAFRVKAAEFDTVIKPGRTHLQDAVPVRMGQEFGAYAASIHRWIEHLRHMTESLAEVGLGGTAIGTGINAPPGYPSSVVGRLSELTGIELRESPDRIEATQSTASFAGVSGSLRLLALELVRISNDLRLMASGPNTGLGEINLPAVQPGSSIMPGKVNPAIAEAVAMVCFQVIGNDLSISMATQAGQLELNVMTPAIAYNLLQSIEIMTSAAQVLRQRCVEGITANAEHCQRTAERSLGMATVLNRYVGYDMAARIAQQSLATGRSMRELVLEKGLMTRDQVDMAFDLSRIT
ncbi:MAG: aspartate ammonia-lyase [Chloroflexi bacterium]|nr:aspartate ammonia-lyase [Chloroflexota bacterium]